MVGHVKEDIKDFLDNQNKAISNEDQVIRDAACKYVYEGDYDCNISYWDNIKNLIDRELEILAGRDSDGYQDIDDPPEYIEQQDFAHDDDAFNYNDMIDSLDDAYDYDEPSVDL